MRMFGFKGYGGLRILVYLFIIFIAGMLQVTLLESFKVFNVKPDLLLISVIFAALIFRLKWALVLGAAAGILKDSLGAIFFGINTALFPLWVFLIIRISKKIPLDNNLIRMALVFIVVVFHSIGTRIIFFALGKTLAPLAVFFAVTSLESLYTSSVLLVAFKIIQSLPFRIEIE